MRRALRLRGSADFARVRNEGKVFRHPVLSLAVRCNSRGLNRYGFIVSKALGGAVVRNRSKRQLRALASRLHVNSRQGFDIVLIARPQLVRQPFDELRRILAEMFKKAHVLDGVPIV